MKALSSLVAILVSLIVRGQQPFPTYADSAQWSVFRGLMGVPVGTSVIRFADTTTICGHQYASIVGNAGVWGGSGYFRNDGQRTLFRRSTDCSEAERVMYDFAAEIGDTLEIGVSEYDSPWGSKRFLVAAIDPVLDFGLLRRRFKVYNHTYFDEPTDPFVRYMYWLEGVGSTTHPFFPLVCLMDGCETYWNLTCFDSLSVPLYRSGPGVTCHENVGIAETLTDRDRFTVTSTGAGTLALWIPQDFRRGHLVILDNAGRIMNEQPLAADTKLISIPPLNAGVFLAELVDEDGTLWMMRWAHLP